MAKHIPNILTVARFFLIPFIIYFIVVNQYITALILLTVSGLTDILDGWIARKFNFITTFGKLIDPLADKATQVSILVTLALKDIIPMWILMIVFIKEFVMVSTIGIRNNIAKQPATVVRRYILISSLACFIFFLFCFSNVCCKNVSRSFQT